MEKRLSIIPKPVLINYTDGEFESQGLPVIKGDNEFSGVIETVSLQLQDDLNKMEKKSSVEQNGKIIFCKKEKKIKNEESCSINISADKITVEASSSKGVYHGLETIRQLVLSEYNDNKLCLPCAEINDYPRFTWRGFMLDCSRYFYTVPFIKKLLDVLSLHHINRFHWHLTDDQGWRLPVKEYPLLTEIGSRRRDHRITWISHFGGFYTEDEIREVVDYASKRQIEVIPEVDLPGHASAILASYPGLGCTGGPYRVEDRFGIFEDVLCAGNDQIFDLAAKIFDNLAELFPSKWVHIGGDEVKFNRWENCPKCQKRLSDLGLTKPKELQSWITKKLVKLLSDRGRTAIGWDEILDDSEKYKLPKETVVMSWRGEKGGINASRLGHYVIMTPNSSGCYLDYRHLNTPEEPGQAYGGAASVYKSYSMDPVSSKIKKEHEHLILGGQGNLWSELIYAGKIAEYMIFPRICAIAETLWTPAKGKDFNDFSKRLKTHRKRLNNLDILQYSGTLR
jgi:hexosaminidase